MEANALAFDFQVATFPVQNLLLLQSLKTKIFFEQCCSSGILLKKVRIKQNIFVKFFMMYQIPACLAF